MSPVFADSFYFLAILNARDPWHELVFELTDEFDGLLVTTGFVLIEVADAVAKNAIGRKCNRSERIFDFVGNTARHFPPRCLFLRSQQI